MDLLHLGNNYLLLDDSAITELSTFYDPKPSHGASHHVEPTTIRPHAPRAQDFYISSAITVLSPRENTSVCLMHATV